MQIESMFPRYVFARCTQTVSSYTLASTRGVHSVVCFGGVPARLDDEVVASLRARLDDHGVAEAASAVAVGDRVIVLDGPFRDLVGVCERTLNAAGRVSVL